MILRPQPQGNYSCLGDTIQIVNNQADNAQNLLQEPENYIFKNRLKANLSYRVNIMCEL